MKVKTWGESQVAVGDTVTATVTVVREHAPEYQGFRRRCTLIIALASSFDIFLRSGRIFGVRVHHTRACALVFLVLPV